jgi:hypothetical protein
LLAGDGNDAALCHVDGEVRDRARRSLRVVTPLDVADPIVSRRRDIVAAHEDRLKEEAGGPTRTSRRWSTPSRAPGWPGGWRG